MSARKNPYKGVDIVDGINKTAQRNVINYLSNDLGASFYGDYDYVRIP